MWIALLSALSLTATAFASNTLLEGSGLTVSSPDHVASQLQPGTVLILGEIHDSTDHHSNQIEMLHKIAESRSSISVGFEFFDWTQQSQVDDYVAGRIPEADFLDQISWGSLPFELYRQQTVFPGLHSGFTVALNAPKNLTSAISKRGLDGLSESEKSLLPPAFALGTAAYFERFRETMVGHVPEDKIQRYFEAQSTWDDTMAWRAENFLAKNPEQILVILVGDFHAAYGGGLPQRLRARGVQDVVAVSQVIAQGLSPEERLELISPHPRYGARGDFVWVTE